MISRKKEGNTTKFVLLCLLICCIFFYSFACLFCFGDFASKLNTVVHFEANQTPAIALKFFQFVCDRQREYFAIKVDLFDVAAWYSQMWTTCTQNFRCYNFFIFVYKTYKTEKKFSLDALDAKCLEYFYTSAMATSTLLHFLPLCKRQPNPVCLLNSLQETVIVE